MEPKAKSINDTAKDISCGRSSVYKLIREGKLDSFKIGRRRLITTASIARLTESKHPV